MHDEGDLSKETKDADEVAHSVAKLLNTRVWMKDATEDKLSEQMEAISNVFEIFKDVDPLRQIRTFAGAVCSVSAVGNRIL